MEDWTRHTCRLLRVSFDIVEIRHVTIHKTCVAIRVRGPHEDYAVNSFVETCNL